METIFLLSGSFELLDILGGILYILFFVGFYSDYVFTSILQQQLETRSVSVGVAGPTEARTCYL